MLGKPITELADKEGLDLDKIDEDARMGGFVVFRGKGYTNYAIASAAVRLANVILNDARAELPVSNYREELDSYLSYPAIVGRNGIVQQLQLDLTDEELAKLQNCANIIKEKFEESKAKDFATE